MSNYMSVGYQTLIMGSSTTYTIDLTNVLQFLDHYNVSNVSNVYIQFDLEAVYTGLTAAEYQWLSSNVDWDSATERVNLGTTIPTSVTAEVWWNVIGQSGGAPSTTTGSLRVRTGLTLLSVYTTNRTIHTNIKLERFACRSKYHLMIL